MGRNAYDLDADLVPLYPIDNAILLAQPRRSMALPFSRQRFIIESLDESQTLGARNSDDILPFLVPLEDFYRELPDLPDNPAMLVELPHIEYDIYTDYSMSIRQRGPLDYMIFPSR